MPRRLIRPSVIVILAALAATLAWTGARSQSGSAATPAQAEKAEKPAQARQGGAPGGSPRGNARPTAVELQPVVVRNENRNLQALGSLKASREVQVRTQSAGRITALNFQDGDSVKAGQLLIQLDDSVARAQLAQAQAKLKLAESQAQRQQRLLAEGFISRASVDQTQSAVAVARADVEMARATAGQMRVLAPFSGVIGLRQVSVGDVLPAGTSAVTLQARSPMWVDFPVNENDVTAVQPGQSLRLALDALPGQTLEGRVLTTDSSLGAQNRSLIVRGQIDNPRGLLRPGMFARVTLELGVVPNTTWVKESALVSAQGRQWLFVAQSPPAEGGMRVKPVLARIGQRREGLVEILGGLSAGQQVVVAGQTSLARQIGTPAAEKGLPVRVVSLQAVLDAAGDRLDSPPPGAAAAPAPAAPK
ncbi:efflux RND transporter periplasmic adaptor subunit [Amphibiibacter pelophylacis]|uniref:Efflux RND transporter periplasmic adaptor subunit n=1 Tax=Amphibiibacter pelophylacis TaxID=1799477 RepID=A0ACC6NYK7_9BURK